MTVDEDPWRLLRLAELLREIERHEDDALRVLNRFEPDMPASFARTFKRAELERVRDAALEIAELADQLGNLAEALPRESFVVSHDDLRASAERLLFEGGTLDAAVVLIAARLLDREAGLRALAACLRADDVRSAWERTTVGRLLTAVRGVSPQLARRIATAAGLAPGSEIAACSSEEITRLADEMQRDAGG